jgi:hypothetical protein
LCEKDLLTLVRFDLPLVSGVSLANIDHEKFDSIAETAMQLHQVPSLGTERRSRIAAEDQSDRLTPAKG